MTTMKHIALGPVTQNKTSLRIERKSAYKPLIGIETESVVSETVSLGKGPYTRKYVPDDVDCKRK